MAIQIGHAQPGITQALSASDAALVQRAGHDYCETKPYEFFDEVPVDAGPKPSAESVESGPTTDPAEVAADEQ